MIEVLDTSDFLEKVASAEPPVNVLPSPRPSNKGGLLVQSGSMDGFYLVMNEDGFFPPLFYDAKLAIKPVVPEVCSADH
jgi:hypothetical protein